MKTRAKTVHGKALRNPLACLDEMQTKQEAEILECAIVLNSWTDGKWW